MKKGLSLPIRIGSDGRSIIDIDSDDQILKLIMIAVGGSNDDNPFQDIGIGNGMVFDINEPRLKKYVQQRIESAFIQLSDRAKITKDGIDIEPDFEKAELNIKFNWINLEKQSENEFNKSFLLSRGVS